MSGCRITIGNHSAKLEDHLDSSECIQFLDLAGSPRVTVTTDGRLEISYDSGMGEMAIKPVAGNVVQIRLVK